MSSSNDIAANLIVDPGVRTYRAGGVLAVMGQNRTMAILFQKEGSDPDKPRKDNVMKLILSVEAVDAMLEQLARLHDSAQLANGPAQGNA